MNDLRQRLHQSLDDQHIDLSLLATRARTQGTYLRRRRRLSAVTASVATVAVLAIGVSSAAMLLPGPPDPAPVTAFAGPANASVPATGRAVTAALHAAVTRVADGTVDRIHGGRLADLVDDADQGTTQADRTVAESVNGSFAFTPAGATSPGEVSLTIRHQVHDDELWDLLTALRCPAGALDCTHSTLPDGAGLMTYRTRGASPSGDPAGFEVAYAERVVGDVIVTAWAANGLDSPIMEGRGLPNQPNAVLSVEQLSEIVSLPWWGVEIPAEVASTPLPSFVLLPGGSGSL